MALSCGRDRWGKRIHHHPESLGLGEEDIKNIRLGVVVLLLFQIVIRSGSSLTGLKGEIGS